MVFFIIFIHEVKFQITVSQNVTFIIAQNYLVDRNHLNLIRLPNELKLSINKIIELVKNL